MKQKHAQKVEQTSELRDSSPQRFRNFDCQSENASTCTSTPESHSDDSIVIHSCSSSNSPSIAELEDSSKTSDDNCSRQLSPRLDPQLQFFKQVNQELMKLSNIYESLTFSVMLSESALVENQINIEDLMNTLSRLGCMIGTKGYHRDDEDQQVSYVVVIEEKTIDMLMSKIQRLDKSIAELFLTNQRSMAGQKN